MERRARALGVTADRVLITSGLLTEEAYVRALARSLGLIFEPLESAPDGDWVLSKDRLLDACAAGLLPLLHHEELAIVVAPRGRATRQLCALANSSPEWRGRFRLTTSERLTRFVQRNLKAALGRRASFALRTERPDLSAAPRDVPWPRKNVILLAAVILGAAIAAPNLMVAGSSIILAALFVAWIALRVVGLLSAPEPRPPLPRRPDASLPVYTLIAALYRESAAVVELVAALDALDWPGIMEQTPQSHRLSGSQPLSR